MNSGLYTVPGDSATALAAVTASRLAAPTTSVSNRYSGIERDGHATGLPAASRLSTSSEMPSQGLEHPAAVQRVGRIARHRAEVERVVHLLVRQDQVAGQVLLVVLEHDRQLADVHALRQQIVLQVLQALEVVVEPAGLAVGHEHDAVGALEHELPGGVVVALARHGVELELGGEAGDGAQLERQEIEEQGAIGLGGERDHAPAAALRHPAVDVLQVGRLAGPARSVVDDLAGDLARREVDQGHAGYRPKSALRLALSSVSKFSASIGGCGLLPRRDRRELLHHLIEEQPHDPHRGLGTEHHQADPASARRRERREHAALPLAVVHQRLEAGGAHEPRQLLGGGDDAGPERGRGHDVERAGEPVLGHHLTRGGHQQREPGRALGQERLQRLAPPMARALASGEPARRVEHLQPREPEVGVRSHHGDQDQISRPGAASTLPPSPRR